MIKLIEKKIVFHKFVICVTFFLWKIRFIIDKKIFSDVNLNSLYCMYKTLSDLKNFYKTMLNLNKISTYENKNKKQVNRLCIYTYKNKSVRNTINCFNFLRYKTLLSILKHLLVYFTVLLTNNFKFNVKHM